MALSRLSQGINWERPNIGPNTGSKYVIQKKMIQAPTKKPNGTTYEPAVWQLTECDPPIFMKIVYNLSVVSNMQTDYNEMVQDILSIFENGRTYLLKQQDISTRVRRKFNRYGACIFITNQKSETINNIQTGNRLFQKDFQLTTETFFYRNVQKYTTKTKLGITMTERNDLSSEEVYSL